jgi:ankyrin repeat protein
MASSTSAADSLRARIFAACNPTSDDAATTANLTALLEECPSPEARAALLAQEDDDGYTFLLYACGFANNIAAVRVLCAAGAAVDQGCSIDGGTPLMLASMYGILRSYASSSLRDMLRSVK